MRTTIDLDEDVLFAAREIARSRGVSMGQVLSGLARQALSRRDAGSSRGGVPLLPVAASSGVVTPDLVNRRRDEAP